MGITERKERIKESFRLQILEAAQELFIQKGFAETSIRNIAEKIEYSPTTIYLYYKDKNSIFHAIHNNAFKSLQLHMSVLYNVQDCFERLKAITRAYVNFALSNKELYELMFILESPIASIETTNNEWEEGQNAFNMLEKTIQECINKNLFPNYSAEALSFLIWSTVHGMCSLYIKNRIKKVFTKENETEILLKGLDTLIVNLEQIK